VASLCFAKASLAFGEASHCKQWREKLQEHKTDFARAVPAAPGKHRQSRKRTSRGSLRGEVMLLTQEASQVNRQQSTVLRQEHGPVLGRAVLYS